MGTAITVHAEENNGHIRTLASSCTICHSNLNANKTITSLAGLDEAYFIQRMKTYQNSLEEHEVMVQHAKGLTEPEITQLAAFFAQQSRACPYYQKHPAGQLLE
jgi:cytochrome c553